MVRTERKPFKKGFKVKINKDIICHRCGIKGHIKKDCRVNLKPAPDGTKSITGSKPPAYNKVTSKNHITLQ